LGEQSGFVARGFYFDTTASTVHCAGRDKMSTLCSPKSSTRPPSPLRVSLISTVVDKLPLNCICGSSRLVLFLWLSRCLGSSAFVSLLPSNSHLCLLSCSPCCSFLPEFFARRAESNTRGIRCSTGSLVSRFSPLCKPTVQYSSPVITVTAGRLSALYEVGCFSHRHRISTPQVLKTPWKLLSAMCFGCLFCP